ncbi:hypothetical protein ACLKA6_000533 [Drosophila palustris]
MGRWGRQSPVLDPPDPQPPPPIPPRTFMRQSSITKIGNMLNTAININGAKKPQMRKFLAAAAAFAKATTQHNDGGDEAVQ